MSEGAYLPPAVATGRAWGFGVNLYALRSARNWGIGDFTDLATFVRFGATVGAAVVGVNPLHALHYVDPEAASPYSPTSRYYLNPLYVDVEAVPEYASLAARDLRERIASEPFARTLAELRATTHVAYARVARAKWSALDALYERFREADPARRTAFRAFVDTGGERLERFAIHEALTERFATADGARGGWLAWPPELQDASGEPVRVWAAKARRRVEYFKYLQWLASDQLASVARDASALAIGLYLDVAVGADINGADVWSDPGAYALDETIGAPPDPLGPYGQNWGLPPLHPSGMIEHDGRAFADLLAANMAYAGALRIDHVMALLRLFRIPRGASPSDGAYVAYPFDELLAIARRESERARCLIVGEDLGNVPNGFRDRMERERIFSYRLLLFEREDDGAFRAPLAYPAFALATATTHDVPTIVGWAIGRDVDVRLRIGTTTAEAAVDAHAERRVDASRMLDALYAYDAIDRATFDAVHGALDARADDVAAYAALVRGAYRFLASSQARLVLIQLDDALCELDQINVPGTFDEYPNWRRKSRLDLAEIARDTGVATLARDVAERLTKGVAT